MLKSYGIQSSKSYAMDTDWVGSGSEEPNRIFEDSVPTVEDIISDITFYLDRVRNINYLLIVSINNY